MAEDKMYYQGELINKKDLSYAQIKFIQALVELGIKDPLKTNLLTVFMELSRNIIRHAGHGSIRIGRIIERSLRRTGLVLDFNDEGPGIMHLDKIFSGSYKSKQGLGLGLKGAFRMADRFSLASIEDDSTHIRFIKWIK